MSAITSDWTPAETEEPVTGAAESGRVYRREEEFRLALDNYMTRYVANQQERRAAATASMGSAARDGYFTVFRRFVGWIRSESPLART
jgi:hypothetical protein